MRMHALSIHLLTYKTQIVTLADVLHVQVFRKYLLVGKIRNVITTHDGIHTVCRKFGYTRRLVVTFEEERDGICACCSKSFASETYDGPQMEILQDFLTGSLVAIGCIAEYGSRQDNRSKTLRTQQLGDAFNKKRFNFFTVVSHDVKQAEFIVAQFQMLLESAYGIWRIRHKDVEGAILNALFLVVLQAVTKYNVCTASTIHEQGNLGHTGKAIVFLHTIDVLLHPCVVALPTYRIDRLDSFREKMPCTASIVYHVGQTMVGYIRLQRK